MISFPNRRTQPLVLVVDDDVTTRLFAREQLEEEGFKVEEVADGTDAIMAYQTLRPDAVLLDVMMPGVDGFTICSQIREFRSAATIPIVMMTALEDGESINRAYDAGATEFTTKPVNWAIEVHRLRYMLRSAQAAYELNSAKDLWERTFNSIDDMVMILDPDLRIRQANDSTRRALRTHHNPVEGKHCYEVFQDRTTPCDGCPLLKTLKTRKPRSAEMEYSALGSTVLMSGSPILDEEANLSGLVYTAKDMSERQQIEAQYRHAQKMEAVGTLAGGIAHDFNNLLQTIMGNSQLLMEDLDASEEVTEDLQQVIHAAARGSELTRQLLTLSRKMRSSRQNMDINSQINQVTRLLERTLPKSIKITTELPEDIRMIHADPGQIEQVIMNLAVNATHAMPDGGTLMLETRNMVLTQQYCEGREEMNPGNYVQVCISDTGSGMDKETMSHIFDPFFTTKGPGEGSGLGLSVSYGILRNHDGHIVCYSEVDFGTTFKLYLPALETLASEANPEPGLGESEIRGGDETILVVEDDAAVRQTANRILTKAGYTVLDAIDGVQALELFDRDRAKIDVVLLDIMMPRMGGIECLKELKQRDPNIKVVIASGYSPKLSRNQAIEEGAKEFIAKPYETTDILRILRKVLDRKGDPQPRPLVSDHVPVS